MQPMQTKSSSTCSAGPKLIFSCSGAADVGELADQTARKLSREGVGKMFCLAGICGRVSGILKTTETATSILAIDGCTLDCAKKSLEEAGFQGFNHLRLTDFGMEKGKTEVTAENLNKAIDKAKVFL
ncbi:MAG: putative zinc-binding protein [Legionella sp.]|uniref:putative zinc-binding protein n=1 Tax=Legionella sp. TaxID=459 RepID=UPI00284A9A4C|nr:putative zinc-binding protein [Legionella sp.]